MGLCGKLSFILFFSLFSFTLSQVCNFQSRISTFDFPVTTPLSVSDIWPWTGQPTFLRPLSNGGSLLVWNDGRGKAYVAKLDSNFNKVGNVFTLPYESCRDVVATADGGIAYIGVRDEPAIHDPPSPKAFCKDPVQNPGGAWCARVDVVRLGSDGNQRWASTVTSNIPAHKPGAHFIWWYGNFMRLASGNGNFAIFYGSAGTNERIEIHQGDQGRYIDENGRLLPFTFGSCSHSSDLRLAYNPSSKKFGAFCFSDNTNVGFHLAITDSSGRKDVTIWKSTAANAAFGTMGGIVPEPNGNGWWLIYCFPEQNREGSPGNIQISHVTGDGVVDKQINLATVPGVNENRPFLASYGSNREFLLAGWSVGDRFVMVVLNLNGQIVSGPTQMPNLNIPIGRDWITLANGDVAWVWKKNDNTLQITKVASCDSVSTPRPSTRPPNRPPNQSTTTTRPPNRPPNQSTTTTRPPNRPSNQVTTTASPPFQPPLTLSQCVLQAASQLSANKNEPTVSYSWTASPSSIGCGVYINDGSKWLTPLVVRCNNQCTVTDTANTYEAGKLYSYSVTCYVPCQGKWSPWAPVSQIML